MNLKHITTSFLRLNRPVISLKKLTKSLKCVMPKWCLFNAVDDFTCRVLTCIGHLHDAIHVVMQECSRCSFLLCCHHNMVTSVR